MTDTTAADKFVIATSASLVSTMQAEAENNTTALRTMLESIRRQPVSGNRDFAIQSLERTISAGDGLRSALGPLHRMLGKYQAEKG